MGKIKQRHSSSFEEWVKKKTDEKQEQTNKENQMFGQGYKRMETPDVAENGIYEVRISGTKVREKDGWNFLEFHFIYENGKDLKPNTFSLFQNTAEQGQKGYEDFCRRATRIFDCFDLNEGFDEKTMASWTGHKGKVEIGKDKKGFAVVKRFLPSPSAASKKATANQKDLTSGIY